MGLKDIRVAGLRLIPVNPNGYDPMYLKCTHFIKNDIIGSNNLSTSCI